MAEKLDLIKQLQNLYNPPKFPVLVEVPPRNFLMIDGHGDPNTSEMYQEALECLYTLAYTIKFLIKKASGIDFGVLPPEGLWWVENMRFFSLEDKSSWDWTMMIPQPDFVTCEQVEDAQIQAARKKNLAALERIRFEAYHEGLSAQMMHIGPYDTEGPNIARLHEYIHQQGCEMRGKHHEIYLSDVRRTAPEKLKTVLRQPVTKSAG